jgi:hypothetical protein
MKMTSTTTRPAGAAHLADPSREVVLVLRQVVRERADLRGEQPAEAAEHRECERDGRHHGDDARQVPPLEPLDDRREHEREQHGERDRDEHVLGDAQAEEREGQDHHLQQRLQPADRVAATVGHVALLCTRRASRG